jgi:SAM-dependent methyltransferase
MKRHDDPDVVEREYTSEAGLRSRIDLYATAGGESPHDLIVELVGGWSPCRVLDVGCGTGTIAKALHRIPDCERGCSITCRISIGGCARSAGCFAAAVI